MQSAARCDLVSHASPYLHVAIIVQSQRIVSGQTRQVFVSNAGMLAGQSDCRNRCLWLIHPFDHGHEV